ncbi:Uu.00g038460.m01.CDS01 [Anthostomella pinea]|uniref:Uu.00g038460.m01.CDS01 n=1 Tax=Anthostomella pinea TaxID=933095 RepID=A0AAI8V4W1_9PEZI|nr:Uu.00g038460.m01.CDS01 [Anthostomella pinea]
MAPNDPQHAGCETAREGVPADGTATLKRENEALQRGIQKMKVMIARRGKATN